MKNQAWIACPLFAVALVGCKSDTEPVSQVPPPPHTAEPEPLPPVSIDEESSGWESSTGTPGSAELVGGSYEPEPLTPAEPVVRTYTIQKGDTFIKLARRMYNDETKWKDIAQANPSLDPRKLMIGQEIVLP